MKIILSLLVLVFSSITASYADNDLPPTLSLTGLYLDITKKEIAPQNHPFSPQYPLWSNGAKKNRWIRLPDGQKIQNQNRNNWQFPDGTKFWKEFTFVRPDGSIKRVETRFMVRINKQWKMASYKWNEDESDALMVELGGAWRSYEVRPGEFHSIPSRWDCLSCHDASKPVLGFGALQLSTERDPMALHSEVLEPDMLTMATLSEEGLLSNPEIVDPEITQDPSNPLQRPAMGYLMSNCSHCHRPDGYAGSTKLHLDYDLNKPLNQQGMIVTALKKKTRYHHEGKYKIKPGNPQDSSIWIRINNGSMPMLGNDIDDKEAAVFLAKYIRDLKR